MVVSTLNKKLIRDLLHLRGQAVAIAFVIAAGVATLILANGAHGSLKETRQTYYERYRFADIFAQARRAPDYVKDQLAQSQAWPLLRHGSFFRYCSTSREWAHRLQAK
jgi:putative ABC transport system permease protein